MFNEQLKHSVSSTTQNYVASPAHSKRPGTATMRLIIVVM